MPNKKLKKNQDPEELVDESEMNEDDDDEEQGSTDQDDGESMSSGEEDSDEDDDDEDFANEEIMIDFEARSILESDMQSVRLLIQQKLGAFSSLNVNDIARIVVQQENIGNVIYQAQGDGGDDEDEEKEDEESKKTEEDDTIFGVLSLIDLQSPQCKAFATKLTEFLINECQKFDKAHKNQNKLTSKLNDILKTKRISYIINERFINVPPGISIPMFKSLLSDLSGENETEKDSKSTPTEPKLNSDYWLFISKLYNECEDSIHGKSSKKASTKQIIYANPEEEIFEEFSELKFEISYGNRASKSSAGNWSANDPDLLPTINVLLVPCDKISTVLNKVSSLIK